MERIIANLYIPSFPLAVARLCRPELRGRPVAVAPSQSPRALITFLSPEAQEEGISKGMALPQAVKICPHLVVINPNCSLLLKVESSMITKVSRYTPLWECWGPGKVYLDLTGTGRLWGAGVDVAQGLRKEIRKDLGLSGAVAVAGSKMVSAIASRIKASEGIYKVKQGQEASFMAPLPVDLLPGIDSVHRRLLLDELNITLVREIVELGADNLRFIFGASAHLIHQQALGIDKSPVYPSRRAPVLREETTLDEDENDDQRLLKIMYRMVERASLRLRIRKLASRRISLTIRYSDRIERGGRAALPQASFWEFELYPPLERLFSRVYRRRVGLRFISLSFEHLSRVSCQLSLFSAEGNTVDRRIRVISAIDEIRERFGGEAATFGRAI